MPLPATLAIKHPIASHLNTKFVLKNIFPLCCHLLFIVWSFYLWHPIKMTHREGISAGPSSWFCFILFLYLPPTCEYAGLLSCYLKLLSIHIICPSLLGYSFFRSKYIIEVFLNFIIIMEKSPNAYKIKENNIIWLLTLITHVPRYIIFLLYSIYLVYPFIIGLFVYIALLNYFKSNPRHITIP